MPYSPCPNGKEMGIKNLREIEVVGGLYALNWFRNRKHILFNSCLNSKQNLICYFLDSISRSQHKKFLGNIPLMSSLSLIYLFLILIFILLIFCILLVANRVWRKCAQFCHYKPTSGNHNIAKCLRLSQNTNITTDFVIFDFQDY